MVWNLESITHFVSLLLLNYHQVVYASQKLPAEVGSNKVHLLCYIYLSIFLEKNYF